MKNLLTKIVLVVCLLISMSPAWAQARTPDELISQILKAVEAKDSALLKALSASDAEVKRFIWPPAVIGNDVTADTFTSGYQRSSKIGQDALIAELGGKKLQLVKVEMPKASKKPNGATVYPAPKVTVKDDGGQEKNVALVGGILEQSGTYKVSTFYVQPSSK